MDHLKKYWLGIVLTIIILASFCLMFFSAREDFLVIDEKVHISAGYLHVFRGRYLFNAEHPPLLNDLAGLFAKIAKPVVPDTYLGYTQPFDQWEYGSDFFYRSNNNIERIIFWARLPFILLTLGLIYLVFIWARALFGAKAGLLAAALVSFEPNILAHGRLATTDIGMVFFSLLAIWLLRKYLIRPGLKSAGVLGLVLGLALLTKFSAIVILPIVLIFLGMNFVFSLRAFRDKFYELILILFTAAIVIWLIYVWSMRADIQDLHSGFIQWLIQPWAKFLLGFKMVLEHNAVGHWAYLNGQVSSSGWWYYFPLVLFYKLTLPFLGVVVLALVYLVGHFKYPRLQEKAFECALLVYPLVFCLTFAIFSRIDIGIRHILIVIPLLAIAVSGVVNIKSWIVKLIIIALVCWQIAIAVVVFPDYIAYFNQIAGGSKNGINHLVDSNLDWNQNMKRLAIYLKENKINQVYQLCWDSGSFDYYGITNELVPASPDGSQGGPSQPVPGVVVICATQLKILPDGWAIDWVKKFPPDEIIDGGVHIWRFDQHNVK